MVLPIGTEFESDIPERLDRLPWSRWHLKVVIALGITWILDGLEVTLVGSVASVLGEPGTLGLSESQIGAAASFYLLGAVIGALYFGRLTDRLGRKKLFLVTLAIYLTATLLTAFSWSFASFVIFRMITGAGIGGECSAVNSAIDELLPARIRGRADLMINGTYWAGTALGALSTLILLNPSVLPHSLGWRFAFGLGAILGVSILLVRRHIPESPRWLLMHGRVDDAEKIMEEIERKAGHGNLPPPKFTSRLRVKGTVTFTEIARVLFESHRRRAFLGLTLMVTQAFAYNAIFFTYALVLSYFVRMFGITAGFHRYFSHRTFQTTRVGQFLLAFLGGAAIQKGALWWAVNHRHHHRESDTEADIHSPLRRGFWWSHVQWFLVNDYDATDMSRIKDLSKYPELCWLNRYHWIPGTLYGMLMYAISGWMGFFWGFVLSTVLLWHGTFAINSLAHVFGKQRYDTGDRSSNNFWLALITLGEGWHNNHHCYMSSTRQGFFWWEVDLTYYVLKAFEKMGLVWSLREPPLADLSAKRIA